MDSHKIFRPKKKSYSKTDHAFIIVGAGLSGMAVFCQLVEKLQNAPSGIYKIKIIEKNPEYFATGEPYQINTPAIWTLNNSAAKMKLTSTGQDASVWMHENKDKWENKFPNIDKEYVPRALIGMYLRAQYALYAEKARSCGVVVEECYDSVVDLSPTDSGAWEIKTEKSQSHSADTIFLCLGHAPSNHYAHLKGKKNYLTSNTSINEFERIPKEEDIAIIGHQASFVDLALLFAYLLEHTGKIHALTRKASIITSKGNNDECEKQPLDELNQTLKSKKPNTLSFADSRELLWGAYCKSVKIPINFDAPPKTKDALAYQIAKYDRKPLDEKICNIDQSRSFFLDLYMGGCYQQLWQALCEEDKAEFNTQFFTTIMALLTGITPLNARLLLELYNREMIVEHSGVSNIFYDVSKKKFIIEFTNKEPLEVNYIINASGYGYNISEVNMQTPFLQRLIEKGLLVPKKLGGIEMTNQGQLITQNEDILDNVFCIGPIASYNHKYPTSFASFIAVEAAKNSMEAVDLALSFKFKKTKISSAHL